MILEALVVDDEPNVAEGLQKLIETFCEDIKVIGVAHNAMQGIQLIEERRPDVVFLDVLMPRFDGFYLLEHFRPDYGFKCVFTTAHEEYAIKAIKYSALDYLLKPVDPDELVSLVDRLKKTHQVANENKAYANQLEIFLSHTDNKRISLPNGQDINWLRVSEIMFVHADGNYCHIKLQAGSKMLVTRRLKYFEEQLGESMFIRIHKSYLVNILRIKGYTRSHGGFILLEDGSELPVSEKYKPAVFKLMGLSKA